MKSARNSEYKVIITYGAKAQLAQILRYLRQDLKSEQAARSVKADMEDTKIRLFYESQENKNITDFFKYL